MPPPLPLTPVPDQPPPRATPRRWPGYLLLGAVVVLLGYLLSYGLRMVDEARRVNHRSAALDHTKAMLLDQEAAWNRGDLDGFMAGYWNDEQLTFASGDTVTRGWQATMDRYRKRYQAEGKEMGTLTFSDQEYEPLGADVVLVRGRWALALTKSEERPSGLYTLVVRKKPDGWKVVYDHTSAAEPAKKN
jgi:beta-aspartyl-peptidase (threonine type)